MTQQVPVRSGRQVPIKQRRHVCTFTLALSAFARFERLLLASSSVSDGSLRPDRARYRSLKTNVRSVRYRGIAAVRAKRRRDFALQRPPGRVPASTRQLNDNVLYHSLLQERRTGAKAEPERFDTVPVKEETLRNGAISCQF